MVHTIMTLPTLLWRQGTYTVATTSGFMAVVVATT